MVTIIGEKEIFGVRVVDYLSQQGKIRKGWKVVGECDRANNVVVRTRIVIIQQGNRVDSLEIWTDRIGYRTDRGFRST